MGEAGPGLARDLAGAGVPAELEADLVDLPEARASDGLAVGEQSTVGVDGEPAVDGREALADELLNGELFYTLQEARILIERWRRKYNEIRPHSSLGYQPPAPEAIEIEPPISTISTPDIELALA